MDAWKKAELDRRRKQRIEQVREQSKNIAQDLRNRVAAEKKRKAEEFAKSKCKELREWQEQQLEDLKDLYHKNLNNVGKAHKEAAAEIDPAKVLKKNKKVQDKMAYIRGKEAMKNLQNEILEKDCKKKFKQKTFRSIPILPHVPQFKVTQTIKTKKKITKNVDNCQDDEEVELRSVDLDRNTCKLNENFKTCEINTKNKNTDLLNKRKISSQPINITESDSNDWACECCKIQRDVGTQCLCLKGSIQNQNKENSLTANIDLGQINTNIFTDVSDRIKSRNLIERSLTKPLDNVYNPDNYSCDVIYREKRSDSASTENISEKLHAGVGNLKNASPLTEISAKIKNGIRCAKECLDNIEPEVLELQKNAEFFNIDNYQTEKPIKNLSPIRKIKPKNIKGTSPKVKSTSPKSLPKVKMYDCNTKYETMYNPSPNLVEKVSSSYECAQDIAQRESEQFDKEMVLRAQKRKDAMAKSQLRGREAFNQKQNMKNLENITKCFDSLALLEKESDACQDRVYNASPYKKSDNLDRVFDGILNKKEKASNKVITLNRLRKSKPNGLKEDSEHITLKKSFPKASTARKQSSINVANLDKGHAISNDFSCADDKSSTTSSSTIIEQVDNGDTSKNEALKDLLDRVNRQKQMLLDEVPQNALPQNSKLNDVLDAVEKSLLEPLQKSNKADDISNEKINSTPEIVRDIKKQKKKMAKKVEELKIKELELDLLIQKYKLNELENKQQNQGGKSSAETLKEVTKDKPVICSDSGNQLRCDFGSSSSDGVQIVIHVKDKSKKNVISTPKKFLIRAKEQNSASKRKTSKTKMKRKRPPVKITSITSSNSSTSYLSPPAELVDVSNLKNIPKALITDYNAEQLKTQTIKQNNNNTNSPSSISKSRFVRTSLKIEKPKPNPLLASYINRLLSMDRDSIDALTVSSCSEVPSPSESVINITSNKLENDKKDYRYTFDEPDKFLDQNEPEKPFIESTPHQVIKTNTEIHKSVHVIDETPKRSMPVQSRGIQVSASNTSEESVHSNTQECEPLNKAEDMQDLAENCNKRITNLVNLINKVRQEKLKLLECSLSSSSSYGQNSTEYLDLPSHILLPQMIDRHHIDKTTEVSKDICQETPPQFEVTDEFQATEEINFTPMLIDIPKPSEIQCIATNKPSDKATKGIEYEITDLRQNMDGINKQLGNLETYMGQIHEYIGDVVKQKQKPPVSLLRQVKNNMNIDTAQAHELSAIMEVDTPMQTKISETNVEIETLENSMGSSDQRESSHIKVTSKRTQHETSGDSKIFAGNIKNIFDNTGLSITLKSPSKYHELSSDLDLEIKPFPTFEEYAKKLNVKTDISEVENNEKSYMKNDETLPDVLSELIKRNVLQRPFDNDTQNSDVSTSEPFGQSPAPLIEPPEMSASISLLSDSSTENTSSTTSTPREFEKALQKLGMNWAVHTLKKTQESIAHSSSSSIEYPTPKTNYLTKKILALKNLNEQTMKELEQSYKPKPKKVVIESSVTESVRGVKKITQNTELSNEATLQKHELEELIKSAQNLSLEKESIFRRLLSTSKELQSSDINLTHIPISQTNQRTSTPVMGDKKFSSSSKGNSLNETLFSGSNLSSVKSNSSDNTNDYYSKS